MMLCNGRSALRSLVLLPVSTILLLSACASPDEDGDPTQVSNLTGTITGVIQDTRGHGIAGATIRYAGASEDGTPLSVTSGSDGSFAMPGVVVSGVSSIGSNDVNGPITLVVASPTGAATYLGATVSATPTAQSSPTVGGGTVFVDGFNVGVGIVKLPQLASSVSGVLRSTTTGTAVGGARLSLNFVGIEPLTTDATPGVATSYDAASMSTTSDGSGNFSFPAAYNDSCLQFVVGNFRIDSITGSAPSCPTAGAAADTNTINLRTSDANSPVLLANVSVSVPSSADTVSPFVASVDGVVDPTQTPAQLASSVTSQFTVHFSEPLQDLLSAADVSVVLGTAPDQQIAQIDDVSLAGGNTAVITIEGALAPSTPVALHIAREALKDTTGNSIALSSEIAYDSFTSQDLILSFVSYGPLVITDTTPPAVASVDGVIDPTQSPAQLGSSVTSQFKVHFSETVQSLLDPADVSVVLGSAPDQQLAQIAAVSLEGGNTAVITIQGTLPPSTPVTVNLARDALKDVAGNSIALSSGIAYDSFTSQNLVLSFVSYGPVVITDTTPPAVASVDGVVDATQNPAQLESSVTNQFKVHFSESLQNLLDSADVSVVLGSTPNQQSAQIVDVSLEGGNTAVITIEGTLPASTPVTVSLAREALNDVAGNGVALSDAIAYDSLTSQNLVLSFVSFGSTSTVADSANVSQVSVQALSPDLAYASTDALLDTVDPLSEPIHSALTPTGASSAYPTTPAVDQLNNSAATAALNALLLAVAPTDTRTVQPGIGRVRVSVPTNATDFVVWLERSGSKQDVLFFPVYTGSGNPQNTSFINNNGPTYVISPNGASGFELIISNRTSSFLLQAGDVFHIVSRNASGVQGGSATLTLADNGRPSVALQLLDAVIAGSNSTGSGGGVVVPGSGTTPATVLLSITPQAADVDDTTSGYASDNWRGDSELQGLSHAELKASTFATNLASGTSAIGDADGTASFLADTAPTLGIAITEPALYTGTVPTTTNVSTTLSGVSVLTNVTNENGSSSNLLAAKVGNVFRLSTDASANTAKIDITASIRDINNLVPDATTRAAVQLSDKMPPLMTHGFYDGTNFTFRFDKPMGKLGSILFTVSGCTAVDLSQSGVTQLDSQTFQFPASLVSATPDSCFALPAYAESAYTAAALSGLTTVTPNPTPPHGAVSYADVPDTVVDPVGGTVGNTWTLWTNQALGISRPFFAMANITPVAAP